MRGLVRRYPDRRYYVIPRG